ncbi:MAG: gamma-glutamyltranspeptidase/glutathione hydrolase, partial [Pirellulaceae bacterium]
MRRLVILAAVVFCTTGSSLMAADLSWRASGKGGAIAAGGADAVQAGMAMLESGGNAADAAAATVLALTVTDHGMVCIGAEVPMIIYDAQTGEVKALSGQGGAPLDPEAIKWYYEHGIQQVKDTPKTAAVPALPSLVMAALKLYGTKSFEEAAAPTLKLLDAGKQDWHKPLAATLRRLIETERKTPGSRVE